MNFLIKLLLSALAVMLVGYVLPGITVENFWVALIVAALLALLNVTLKPLLVVLTIPVTILTLGLFLLVINALIILLADALISGFMVSNFWWALAFSLILSIVTSIFESLVGS
jgi:putative membrane protein